MAMKVRILPDEKQSVRDKDEETLVQTVRDCNDYDRLKPTRTTVPRDTRKDTYPDPTTDSAVSLFTRYSALSKVIVLPSLLSFVSLVVAYKAKGHFISIALLLVAVICLIDATARTREFLRLQFRVTTGRTMMLYKHSWCRRMALYQAANIQGKGKEVKDYYYTQGYRWYHILPDKWRQTIFTKKFWAITFGIKR